MMIGYSPSSPVLYNYMKDFVWARRSGSCSTWSGISSAIRNVLSNSFLWKNSCIGFRKTVEFLITQLAKEIPVLEFVSKENCKTMPQWEQLHRDIIADKENGEVILLEGSHYLHFEQKKAIVERTIQWIENR